MRMNLTRALIALVSGAAALTLTACSEDAASDTSAGLEGEPIKIGQIAPTDTATYNAQDSVAVARAAVRGINERGGIDGRPLEIVYCNNENDPNAAAACARELVSEQVVAVVRSIVIEGGDQVSAILDAAGIPDVGRGALTPAEFNAPNAYLLDGGVISAYAGALARFAEQGGEALFLATAESASGPTTIAALKNMASKLGVRVVGTASIPYDTADYAPLAAQIKDSGAEGAVLAFTQQQIVQTIKAADQTGVSVNWLLNGGGITESDLETLAPAQTEKFIVGTATLPMSASDQNDQVAQMQEDIEAQFEAGDEDADPKKLFPNAYVAWAAIYALTEVFDGLDTISAETVRNALDEANDLDVGISTPWTPSRPGPNEDFSRVSHPFTYVSQVENNQLVLLQDDPIDVTDLMS
jgi:ABC-type branched-subunit amino acid transport system substrate-binding protein